MQPMTKLMMPVIKRSIPKGATAIAACRHPADRGGEGVVVKLATGAEVWTLTGSEYRSINPRDWREAEHTLI